VVGRWFSSKDAHGARRMMTCAYVFTCAASLWLSACGATPRRIDVVTYDPDGTAHTHYADFSEGYYRLSPNGGIDLVLHCQQPSGVDPTQTITQAVYLKAFWIPRPGKTFADSSQINARLYYAVWTPPTGVRYDGAGFAIFQLDASNGILTGQIESGILTPRFRLGNAVEPFGTARFTGRFEAREDPARVVALTQQIGSQFSRPL
jgi:hypothetical protein